MPKLSLLFGLMCAGIWAQSPVGSIAGVVKDPSGAVVAGAVATSTSSADGGKRRVTTDEQGFFLIPTLMPGDYKLTIEAKGLIPSRTNGSKRPNPITYDTDEARLGHSHQQ